MYYLRYHPFHPCMHPRSLIHAHSPKHLKRNAKCSFPAFAHDSRLHTCLILDFEDFRSLASFIHLYHASSYPIPYQNSQSVSVGVLEDSSQLFLLLWCQARGELHVVRDDEVAPGIRLLAQTACRDLGIRPCCRVVWGRLCRG